MKKVITFGVFDYFHYGHLCLLEQAKELGDYLIVAIQKDEIITKYKPNEKLFYSNEQRIHMIESLKIVDCVVLYKDVDNDIQSFDFDVFAVGEDQTHKAFQNAILWCKEHNKEVTRLHRTSGISSTMLKRVY